MSPASSSVSCTAVSCTTQSNVNADESAVVLPLDARPGQERDEGKHHHPTGEEFKYIADAVDVVLEAYRRLQEGQLTAGQIGVSFNAGKDAVAMLDIIEKATVKWNESQSRQDLQINAPARDGVKDMSNKISTDTNGCDSKHLIDISAFRYFLFDLHGAEFSELIDFRTRLIASKKLGGNSNIAASDNNFNGGDMINDKRTEALASVSTAKRARSPCDNFPPVNNNNGLGCYDLRLIEMPRGVGMREGVWQLTEQYSLRIAFVGMRHADPSGRSWLRCPITPCTSGWPPSLTLFCPLLPWTYSDLWRYTLREHALYTNVLSRGFHSEAVTSAECQPSASRACVPAVVEPLPFCELYAQGYTSLGDRNTTQKHPRLLRRREQRVATDQPVTQGESYYYLPAWELDDDDAERDQRS